MSKRKTNPRSTVQSTPTTAPDALGDVAEAFRVGRAIERTTIHYAIERAHQLAHAIDDMASRYGRSAHCSGMAYANGRGETNGKTVEQWDRATDRQFRALLRLTRALRDVDVTR